MEAKFTVQAQAQAQGDGQEEPGIKIEIQADSLLDLAGLVPAEVSGPGSLFLETINPVMA